jgi:hypothetical protein
MPDDEVQVFSLNTLACTKIAQRVYEVYYREMMEKPQFAILDFPTWAQKVIDKYSDTEEDLVLFELCPSTGLNAEEED